MSTELWQRSANELATMIKAREVTSREVVEAHLTRIEAVNPHLNAVTRVLTDSAREAADAADAAVAAGGPLGPLHGVPFTVKENIDLVGSPTTSAVVAFAEALPTEDSPVVQRMKEAGAVPLARTNLPDFGLRVTTSSQLHGRTLNPWDSARTTGGSSGGEGSALASGMSPIGLGNDIGGSLRNPAHCCGIASIKPSLGVVADAVQFPMEDASLSSQLMLAQGVMARRVADVRTGFEIVARTHPRDPYSVPARLTDLAPGERVRIAVLADPPGGSTDAGVAGVIRAAADALSDAGHDVVEACPPDYEMAIQQWSQQLGVDILLQKPLLELVMGEEGMRFLDLTQEIFNELDLAGWAALQAARHGLARRWNLWFEEHPVLLSPVWAQPPFLHDADIADLDGARTTLELLRPVLPANLLGLPAAVVPGGLADGLPVGVQVCGARYTDLRCLSVAEQIEASVTPLTPIDPRP
jgi:amidase